MNTHPTNKQLKIYQSIRKKIVKPPIAFKDKKIYSRKIKNPFKSGFFFAKKLDSGLYILSSWKL